MSSPNLIGLVTRRALFNWLATHLDDRLVPDPVASYSMALTGHYYHTGRGMLIRVDRYGQRMARTKPVLLPDWLVAYLDNVEVAMRDQQTAAGMGRSSCLTGWQALTLLKETLDGIEGGWRNRGELREWVEEFVALKTAAEAE